MVFLLSKGTFTNIDVDLPGAMAGSTQAYGINPRGDIVGYYADTNFITHGFLLRKRTFTKIDAPGARATIPLGINPQGDIVGSYDDSIGNTHGFLLPRADLPSSMYLRLLGPRRPRLGSTRVAILWGTTATGGFLLSEGTFTRIDVPGALFTSTQAYGINPRGDIVGSYIDNSDLHGFLLSKGRFTAIDVPVAFGFGAKAFAINPQGDIVGSYYDGGGNTHGFLLSK